MIAVLHFYIISGAGMIAVLHFLLVQMQA